uniref:Rho GTPase-activating protein 3 n=1 Tax=Noccaea caerulescens TaxID=107243 RepID=A0A1J3D0S6_NOCCA
MTSFSRSKSTGTIGFRDFKPTRPDDDDYEEEQYSTTSTDYYDVSTPLSSHGSRSGSGSGQFTVLDLLAAVLRKSLVMSCTMERGDDDVAGSMDIGWPTEVKHVSHVTFDRFNGFLGLPSELEPEVPPRAPSASVSVFGVSAKSMQCSYDDRGNSVPTILLRMQKRLYTEGGLQAEGIFRINPDNAKEEHVRRQLNRGVVPRGIDVHCLAGLIKAWFRELPTGVLDVLTAEQVMKCNTEEDCSRLVTLLPPVESALLDWAIGLMADVVEHEQFNKMNARNVAMVFAPNMTQMADPLTALIHAVQVMNFLKTLILMNLKERENADAKARWIEKQTSDPSEEWESQHSEILDSDQKLNNNPKFLRVATLCRLEADNEEEFWNSEKRNDHDQGTTENIGTVQRLCKHPLFQLSKSAKKPLVSNRDEGRRGRDAWGPRLSSLPW